MNNQYWQQEQELLPEFEAIAAEFEEELFPEIEFKLAGEISPVSRKTPEYIRWVQSSLNKILLLNLSVDGISGRNTKSAIRSFQTRQHLKVDSIVGPITEAALIRAGAGQPPKSRTVIPPGPTPRPVSGSLRSNIVNNAFQEWNKWAQGSKKESDASQQSILNDYWVIGTGSDYGYTHNGFWSAAFISWIMKKAGAAGNFRYSGAHTTYTYAAKQNRLQNNANPFKAYRINEKRPEPGDIIVQNRGRSGFTYDNLQSGQSGTHGDIVVKVNAGTIEVIGGNVSDSVSKKTYSLTPNGFLNSAKHFAIIKIEVNSGSLSYEFETRPSAEFEFEMPSGSLSRKSKEYIKWVQGSLNQVSGLRLKVDGISGLMTRSAIRNFQKQKGLTADGIVGEKTEQALQTALRSQPLRPTPTPADTNLPAFISDDNSVSGYTFYVDIDLGNVNNVSNRSVKVARKTGIFVPANFLYTLPVDLVIYLHGFKNSAVEIDSYWDVNRYPHFALREEVNSSRRNNVIFVAPTLGTRSEAGALIKPGGFDDYINKVIAAVDFYFIKKRNASQNLTLRNIILSAHSGGGSPMLKIAQGRNVYSNRISECWAFDSLYQGVNEWAKWALLPGKSLFVYYLSSTANNAVQLKKIGEVKGNRSILVTQSSKGHKWVPKLHLKERVEGINPQATPISPEMEDVYDHEINEREDENIYYSTLGNDLVGEILQETPLEPVQFKGAPFAGAPAAGSYWPIITSYAPVVHYNTANGYIGNKSRSFGWRRDAGDRYHVGIDLEAKYRDEVVACQDGKILAHYKFCCKKYNPETKTREYPAQVSYSLIVDHGNIVVNYGEVDKDLANGLKVNDKVKAGQVIAYIGKNPGNSSMLHFETYEAGTKKNISWPYGESRPAGILDPTKYLLFLKNYGLKASKGTLPPQPAPRGSFDMQKAIRNNIYYSQALGWIKYQSDIEKLLGFTNISPSAERFAEAVAVWQGKNAMGRDGIIGKGSWQKMQPLLRGASTAAKFSKAVRLNESYARTLGWMNYQRNIEKLLGFTNVSPSPEIFAEAVARWQAKNGLSSDGIIGKGTWGKMRPLVIK